jgi:acetate kinase
MKPPSVRILTINGGSSSIKFALFEAGDSLRRILAGAICAAANRTPVRVIQTDEEWMISNTLCRVPGLGMTSEKRNSDYATRSLG